MSDDSSDDSLPKEKVTKRRTIFKCVDSDDQSEPEKKNSDKSDNENLHGSGENEEEQSEHNKSVRIKDKKSKMTNMFKKRFSKTNESESNNDNKDAKLNNSGKSRIPNLFDSDSDDDELSNKPKDIVRSVSTHSKKTNIFDSDISDNETSNKPEEVVLHKSGQSKIPNLYDSDSSDGGNKSDERQNIHDSEEDQNNKLKSISKKSMGGAKGGRNKSGGAILIEPKAQRMSAKQAMEQMQKIKSESGRMLREKDISLPYHRPKQISLKEILAKKKIDLTTGNKRLRIKMDEDQLKNYAKELEEREKEMIELCKSESDDDETPVKTIENKNPEDISSAIDNAEKTTESEAKDSNICRNLNDVFQKEEDASSHLLSTDPIVSANTKSEDIISNETGLISTSPEIDPNSDEIKNLPDTSGNENINLDINAVSEVDGAHPDICDDVNKIIAKLSEMDDEELHDKNNHVKISDGNEMIVENIHDTITDELSVEKTLVKDDENDSPNITLHMDTESPDLNSINDIHNENAPSETQPIESNRQKFLSQMIQSGLPDIKPTLTGSPGLLIDLISGDMRLSGVALLKQKFLQHAAMKTPVELEREKEKRIQPGAALLKLKRKLEDEISDQRTQEWTKRVEQEAIKKQQEKELNGDLSDCEELLEKEETCHIGDADDANNSEENDEDDDEDEDRESEPEPEPEIKETKSIKCGFIDEEAEDEDDDESGVENGSNGGSIDEESSEDSDDELVADTQERKKNLTRIIKAFNESDSSDDEITVKTVEKEPMGNINNSEQDKTALGDSNAYNDVMNTPMKQTSLQRVGTTDMFESQSIGKSSENFSADWDDELPLGQKLLPPDCTPTSLTKSISRTSDCFESAQDQSSKGRSDLAGLVSPIIRLPAIRSVASNDNVALCQSMTSPNTKKLSPQAADKWINLQKKLFTDQESEPFQDTQDLANLCSGEFPTGTGSTDTSLRVGSMTALFDRKTPSDTQMTQNTENELMELCTGKFVGINDGTSGQNTLTKETENRESEDLCLSWSEPVNSETIAFSPHKTVETKDTDETSQSTRNKVSENSPNVQKISSEVTVDIGNKHEDPSSEKVSKTIDTNRITAMKNKPKTIRSFFAAGPVEKNIDTPTNIELENTPKITASKQNGKFVIMSSSDDEMAKGAAAIDKKKKLKSRKERNKKRQLQISDDEQSMAESEVENDADCASPINEMDDERLVEYDSEENEVPQVKVQPEHKKKMTSEFFDHEAELTSEDEWKGSGDEDERNMDVLEWEEGDADHVDHRQVKKQLERMHMRDVLDQDKRDVKLLKEMLLDDDDLEGGTRERKFRWRNVDSGIESGAVVGDDIYDVAADEAQSEEQWRKQRHERETFLRQMEKENTSIESSQFSQEDTVQISSKTSFTRTSMSSIKSIKNQVTLQNNGDETGETEDNVNKKVVKDLPSPVKKPFSLKQNYVRGSFLARGEAAMARLALLTKNSAPLKEGDQPANLSSLAPGKKRNFVFAAVSPPCEDITMSEEVKMAKRKATSEISTPALIKKIRVSEGSIFKSRKSLMDHLE